MPAHGRAGMPRARRNITARPCLHSHVNRRTRADACCDHIRLQTTGTERRSKYRIQLKIKLLHVTCCMLDIKTRKHTVEHQLSCESTYVVSTHTQCSVRAINSDGDVVSHD
jgi:hypothetical protein